jgi:adenosylcobinamide-GDP ribazoletransferase
LIKPLFIALSTYSKIPVPQFDWTERNLRYSLCFLPVVGAICGGLLYGWIWLCGALSLSGVLFACVAVCLPLLLTGGIHMDGYMDTVDALSSHAERARKLEILKDPHTGAFAVLFCGVYLLVQTGLLYELYRADAAVAVCPVYVLSRALSAALAVGLKNARHDGMLHAYTKNVEKGVCLACSSAVAALAGGALLFLAGLWPGLCAAALCALWAADYARLTKRQFGGVTGDTAGFFLQLCELLGMLGLLIGGLI